MNGGELLAKALSENGINDVFALLGNQLNPILVYGDKYNIQFIGVRHEQAAVQMADGWAQVRRHTGCAMVIGGPGFTNVMTGIVKAFLAETPILVIVGRIETARKDRNQMQDVNHRSMIQEYCKAFYYVEDAERIEEYISRGIDMAYQGRRGPVVLEIPINILTNEVSQAVCSVEKIQKEPKRTHLAEDDIKDILQIIYSSNKPIIILGDNVYYSEQGEAFREMVDILKIPVFCTNKARGIIADDHKYCFRSARVLAGGTQFYAYKEADVIVAFGVSPDYQMGNFESPYFNRKQIFIEFDSEGQKLLEPFFAKHIVITGDLYTIAQDIVQYASKHTYNKNCNGWISELKSCEAEIMENVYCNLGNNILHPASLIAAINQYKKEDTIIVLDGGNAALWGEFLFNIQYPGGLLVSSDGTLGSIGCGLALAIGAKMALPEKDVILYTGDGSLGYNLSEVDTACTYRANIKIVIHNDEAWGFCKFMQVQIYNKEVISNLRKLEYEKILQAFGGKGYALDSECGLKETVSALLEEEEVACLNAYVDQDAISPGASMFSRLLRQVETIQS